VTANSRALLEGKQLLGTEGLVVDLRSGFDEVLEVGAGEEVAQVDELAVVLVLDCDGLVMKLGDLGQYHTVDDTPLGLATTDVLSVNDNRLLGANDGEGNEILF
jgi:hypothetical protein